VQCDVDVLGSPAPAVEAEVILATTTALAQLGFERLVVRLNARPLLTLLVRSAGVPERAPGRRGDRDRQAVRWGADQRKELEHLCRYITRPAIANERLKRNRAGDVVLQLKSAFKDGTTHIVMAPLEFMQRLAALVPRPRLHLIRFHGVLAPNAKLRSEIIPSPVEQATEPACDHAQAQGAPARMSWARLLKRVFDIDIDHCPNCGGSLKIIAAIEDPPVIVRILTHLGLPTRAPPRAPAQRVDLFQTI
jgi:Putative transposase